MVRLSRVLYGLVFVGLIVSGLIVFISDGVVQYAPADYNETQLETFNKMTELNNNLESFEQTNSSVDSDSNNDVLGSLFTNAYQSAQILKNSGSILTSMINDGVDALPLGGFGSVLKTSLGTLILIAISVALFLGFIIKSGRE